MLLWYCCFWILFVPRLLLLRNCIFSFVIAIAKWYLFLCYCCCQIVFVCLLLLLPYFICSFVITNSKLYLCPFLLLLPFVNWICLSNIAIAKLYLFVCYSCSQIVFVPLLLLFAKLYLFVCYSWCQIVFVC